MKVTFDDITQFKTIRYKCRSCNKPRTKNFRVSHTINPWNKNEDGEPKSHSEVAEDVSYELSEKIKQFLVSPHCSACIGLK